MRNSAENNIGNIINSSNEKSYLFTEKVFYIYKDKEYLPNIIVNCEKDTIMNIKFKSCKVISKIFNNNEKVKITLKIPYEINTKNGDTIIGFLPNITREIILKSNINYQETLKFVVKSSTKLIFHKDLFNNKSKFTVLVRFMISRVGQVKLLIPDIYSKSFDSANNTLFNDINVENKRKSKIKSKIKSDVIDSNNKIISGRIFDKTTLRGIKDAVVGLFYGDNISDLQMLCHTYSNNDGCYSISIPREIKNKVVTVMASKTFNE